jgi:hypothetical protein
MTKTYLGFQWSLAAVLAVGATLGCSDKKNDIASSHDQLTGPNGMVANGMVANGMVANGMVANGMVANGMVANGMVANGLWQGGLWQTSALTSKWWENSTWEAGKTGAAAFPGDTLRSNPYLRILLQYMYQCAMPPTISPTSLDPNNGTLLCSPSVPCDDGYECTSDTADGTCVVPLRGAAGVGINADGTSWAESGTCDESCQRWVSACILARTNAYGVHVLISMRAPANTPPGRQAQFDRIRAALQTTAVEVSEFNRREGAYYGNLFATTPGTFDANGKFVPDWITEQTTTGTSIGTIDQTGAFVPGIPPHGNGPADAAMMTPVFTGCAGPSSNVPEITKRFVSSQGNQLVVNVPGVCLPDSTLNPAAPGTCAPDDGNPDGAMHECFTNTDPTQRTAADEYNEVITVFLKDPIAVCGNQVCEAGEDSDTCRNDCPPGVWAKDFDDRYGIGGGVVDLPADDLAFPRVDMAAIAPKQGLEPNNGVVVVGWTGNDIDLGDFVRHGDGRRPAADGYGVLAKYDEVDGTLRWSRRFMPSGTPSVGYELAWDVSGGVTVAPNGNITVLGTMVEDFCITVDNICLPQPTTSIWVDTFNPDGVLVAAYTLPVGGNPLVSVKFNQPLVHVPDMTLTRAVAADSEGNVFLAGGYCGNMNFDPQDPSKTLSTVDCDLSDYSSGGFGNNSGYALFAAKLAQSATPSRGKAHWVHSLGELVPPGAIGSPDPGTGTATGGPAGFEGMSMTLVPSSNGPVSYDALLLTSGVGAMLTKLSGTDGAPMWPSPILPGNAKLYSVVTVDAQANIYVGGYFGNGANFDCPGAGTITGVSGLPPFVQKLNPDGSCRWMRSGTVVCPFGSNTCGPSFEDTSAGRSQVQAVSIGFDSGGNVLLGSYGNPFPGGGINFGGGARDAKVGVFPTYKANNIFLSAYNQDAGRLVWAKQVPTIVGSFLLGMETDAQGRVVLSGNYSGSMDVLGRLLVTRLPEQPRVIDSFLASFDGPPSNDNDAPVIGEILPTTNDPGGIKTVPKPILVQATSAAGAAVYFVLPTARDDGGNMGSSVSCLPNTGSTFPIGTTTVTCTASDALGNQSPALNGSFTVTVADNLAPVFLPALDITVQATSAAGVAVTYALPKAFDQVDGPIVPTCLPGPGIVFGIGKTTVACDAIDHSNNESQATFIVNVTPPALGGPCTKSADCTTGYCVDGVCCSSACGGGSPNDCQACSVAAGGSLDGTCTAAAAGRVCRPSAGVCDAAESCDGASLTCPSDAQIAGCGPPVVTVPTNMSVEATSLAGATVNFSVSAKDWHGVPITTVNCTPMPGSTFAIGTKTVTCTATDSGGLTGSASFTITVRDTKGPVFSGVPTSPIVAYATCAAGAKVTYATPTANDAVDGKVAVSCKPASESQFVIGQTTVKCTASDAHGNTSTASFTVWVKVQAPTDGSFYLQPINSDGSSIFKLGSTVPVKFKLTGASAGATDLVAKLTVGKVSSQVTGSAVEAVSTAASSSGGTYRYDAAGQQYIFNLSTKGMATGTWQLQTNLGDRVPHMVNISLK